MNTAMITEVYMSLDEVAQYLKVPLSTLYKYTSANTHRPRLRGVKMGRSLRFTLSEVHRWLAEMEDQQWQ